MSAITLASIGEIPAYEGPHAIPGIRFRAAAKALGVSAWGMNILELDAGATGYPKHDHVADGQEEVYVVLKGSATFKTDDTTEDVSVGMLVRVSPEVRRWFIPGPDGVTLLALGGTPGKAYVSNL